MAMDQKKAMQFYCCLYLTTLTACGPSTVQKNKEQQDAQIPTEAAEDIDTSSKEVGNNFIYLHEISKSYGSDQQAFESLLHTHTMTLVVFYADWCVPCTKFVPILKGVAAQEKDVLFLRVNIDHSQKIVQRYSVRGIPCVVFIKNGKEVYRAFGSDLTSTRILRSKINNILRKDLIVDNNMEE